MTTEYFNSYGFPRWSKCTRCGSMRKEDGLENSQCRETTYCAKTLIDKQARTRQEGEVAPSSAVVSTEDAPPAGALPLSVDPTKGTTP